MVRVTASGAQSLSSDSCVSPYPSHDLSSAGCMLGRKYAECQRLLSVAERLNAALHSAIVAKKSLEIMKANSAVSHPSLSAVPTYMPSASPAGPCASTDAQNGNGHIHKNGTKYNSHTGTAAVDGTAECRNDETLQQRQDRNRRNIVMHPAELGGSCAATIATAAEEFKAKKTALRRVRCAAYERESGFTPFFVFPVISSPFVL